MASLLPGSRLGRYQILAQIGRGGMASVFRAHDPKLDTDVAVKVLSSYRPADPSLIERFKQEAQTLSSLDHPNIIKFLDFGEDKGFSYIVMEYLTGGTLHERLGCRLSLAEILEWIGPLANALESAHKQGIVHRDIKPSNVLFDADGTPQLSDFGLARLLEASAGLTGTNAVLGTPDYISPEEAMGRLADERSDLYSLGVVIYQMLLGKTPFKGETPMETLMAHIHQAAPLATEVDPDIDPRLDSVLFRILAKGPDDRYQSPTQLIEALTQVSSSAVLDDEATVETPVVPTSLDQASAIAIRLAEENADFYGPRYAGRKLRRQVVSAEESENSYVVDLAYRPRGRFWLRPRVERFTIDKVGTTEFRRIVSEPLPRRRLGYLAAGLPVLVAVVAGGLLASDALRSEPSPPKLSRPFISMPPVTVTLPADANEPVTLVAADGHVTVGLEPGSVDEDLELSFKPLAVAEVPPLPSGFTATRKVFELSVVQSQTEEEGDQAEQTSRGVRVQKAGNDYGGSHRGGRGAGRWPGVQHNNPAL